MDVNNALESASIAAEQASEDPSPLQELKSNCNDAYAYVETHGAEVDQEDKLAYRLHNMLGTVQDEYVDAGPMAVAPSLSRADELNPTFAAERPYE